MHRKATNVLPVPVGSTTTPRRPPVSQACHAPRTGSRAGCRSVVSTQPASACCPSRGPRPRTATFSRRQLFDDGAVVPALGAVGGGPRVEQHAGQGGVRRTPAARRTRARCRGRRRGGRENPSCPDYARAGKNDQGGRVPCPARTDLAQSRKDAKGDRVRREGNSGSRPPSFSPFASLRLCARPAFTGRRDTGAVGSRRCRGGAASPRAGPVPSGRWAVRPPRSRSAARGPGRPSSPGSAS